MSRLLRFLIAGSTAAAAEYVTFIILYDALHMHIVAAQSLSFGVGLVVSYTLNRIWVFKSGGSKKIGILQIRVARTR